MAKLISVYNSSIRGLKVDDSCQENILILKVGSNMSLE